MKTVKELFDGRDEINIVFLGGSITEGAGASEYGKCYASMTGEWLKRELGAERTHIYNRGVGGTDSMYGLFRLKRDVLSCNPDVVFVEFAVNDSGKDTRAYMESIVRTLCSLPEPPYIVFLYTANEDYSTDASYHKEIADYYGIPQISLKDALKRELGGENAREKNYLKDDVHPTDAGYAVYYKEMVKCLSDIEYFRKPPAEKPCLIQDSFAVSTEFIPPDSVKRSGGWSTGGSGDRKWVFTENIGETLEFEFEGDIFALEHGLHKDSGIYSVYIDGVLAEKCSPFYKDAVWDQLVMGFSKVDLERGNHRVKIITEENPDGGRRVFLYNFIIGTKC